MADTAVEAPPAAVPQSDPKEIGTEGEAKTNAQTQANNTPNGQAKEEDAPNERSTRSGRDNGFRGRGGRYQGNRKFDRNDSHHGKSRDGRQNGHDKSKQGKFAFPKGNRSKLEVEEESNDPVQIRKQVEFYFSDSNLPADKFLFGLVGGHENKPVPLATIHSFRRMRHFQPFSAVVKALKESSVLDIVEIEKTTEPKGDSKGKEDEVKAPVVRETTEGGKDSKEEKDESAGDAKTLENGEAMEEDKDNSEAPEAKKAAEVTEDTKDGRDQAKESTLEICIKRKIPLAAGTTTTQSEIMQVFADAAMARSVYVKGFGAERPGTQFDIEAWFSEFGPTNAVRLRRTDDKTFKGSVFVEFDSEETAKKFLAIDPQPTYRNRSLVIKGKKQYHDDQVAEMNEGRMRVDGTKPPDVKNRDWRDMREEDRKKGFPPPADGAYGSTKAPTNKRSHEDSNEDAGEERAAKKVDTEGAASADKTDENITDAPPSDVKAEAEGDKNAEAEQSSSAVAKEPESTS